MIRDIKSFFFSFARGLQLLSVDLLKESGITFRDAGGYDAQY